MQPFERPTKKNRLGQVVGSGGYTAAEVTSALTSVRYEVFRHELHRIVSGAWTVVADITKLVQNEPPARIDYDRFGRGFMRHGTYRIYDDGTTINWRTDAIRSFWMLLMPDGNFAEWMVGTFYITTPTVALQVPLIRDVVAPDALTNLEQAKLEDWLTIPSPAPTGFSHDAGDPVGWTRTLILQRYPLAGIDIPDTSLRVPADAPKLYEPGTPVLEIANDLMLFINYREIRANFTGSIVSEPFLYPSARAVEYIYQADGDSVLIPNTGSFEQDLFNAPNQWVRIVSRPDRSVLRASYTLDDPANPLSTAYRGRTVTDYAAVDMADQATLDAYVRRLVEESQRIAGSLPVNTVLMPHDHADKVIVSYPGKPWDTFTLQPYIERSWTMELKAGGRMTHVFELAPITVPP